MKYFEFTFDTHPCTETVNDVLAAVLGEAGFESFVEREGGLTAYIQQSLYNEEILKTELANFPIPDTKLLMYLPKLKIKTGTKSGKEFLSAHCDRKPLCDS